MRDAGSTDTMTSVERFDDSTQRRVARGLNKDRIASRAATSRTDLGNEVSRVAVVVQKNATAHER